MSERDLDLRYLQAEVARIDVYVRREVWRWQLAGQDPTDAFRGLYLSDADALTLLDHPFGVSWGQSIPLEPEELDALAAAETHAEQQSCQIAALARQQGQTLRLEQLATTFGLDQFELDTLLIGIASTLDRRYEQLFGYLQDNLNRKQPGIDLVLTLLGEPGRDRLALLDYFEETAPLRRFRLLHLKPEPGSNEAMPLRQALWPDPTVVAWLLGCAYRPHPILDRHASLQPPEVTATDRLLAEATLPALERAIEAKAILVCHGPDRLSQFAAAKFLAARLDKPLLAVNLGQIIGDDLTPLEPLRLALRDARLFGAVPYLSGWDICLTGDKTVPSEILDELCCHPDLVIVAGQHRWQPTGLERNRPLHWLEFPVLDHSQRLRLWEHFLQNSELMPDQNNGNDKQETTPESQSKIPKEHFVVNRKSKIELAGQFSLTGEQIRDVIASARDAASEAGRTVQTGDLFAAARTHANPNLSGLARKITPRFEWADIILPADPLAILREIVSTIRQRPRVLEAWGVGRKLASSAGVTVLFAGPPGTGKTMAAEVIAGELGLDLFKIDLSGVVSKYIGETEKNLEKIFNEAQSSSSILFFDEADAIFGKRSEVKDAHDRYANVEISYLLQRMEAYDGVTILATNLRANLDEAFTRRLQFAVDFPFPEVEDRLRIWQTLFPPDVPRQPALDFERLARRFELAGGNIRNVIVSAAYLAAADGGRVTMAHLLHGTRRELQKMGRLISGEEL